MNSHGVIVVRYEMISQEIVVMRYNIIVQGIVVARDVAKLASNAAASWDSGVGVTTSALSKRSAATAGLSRSVHNIACHRMPLHAIACHLACFRMSSRAITCHRALAVRRQLAGLPRKRGPQRGSVMIRSTLRRGKDTRCNDMQ